VRYLLTLAALALIGFYAWTIHAANEAVRRMNDRAIIATTQCVANTAYTRSMFEQCFDDYYRMRGWR
jgi:hypothetical protein